MENKQQTFVYNKPASNGLAVTALVLGIIAVVLNIVPFIPYILAILALIFGIIGRQGEIHKGLALAGIILGAVALVMKIGFWILLFFGMAIDLAA